MSDFRNRIIAEHSELTDRSNKLRAFLWGDVFDTLHPLDRELLIKQLAFMEGYSITLAERIARAALQEPEAK